jgi:hypothetical protein
MPSNEINNQRMLPGGEALPPRREEHRMSVTTGPRPTLAELHAQLRAVAATPRTAQPAPADAAVHDKLAHYAALAEQRAARVERERDLWNEVAIATYDTAAVDRDQALALLRDAVFQLSSHVALEALEARRYADNTAQTLATLGRVPELVHDVRPPGLT